MYDTKNAAKEGQQQFISKQAIDCTDLCMFTLAGIPYDSEPLMSESISLLTPMILNLGTDCLGFFSSKIYLYNQ